MEEMKTQRGLDQRLLLFSTCVHIQLKGPPGCVWTLGAASYTDLNIEAVLLLCVGSHLVSVFLFH